jgi:hypothetical protein
MSGKELNQNSNRTAYTPVPIVRFLESAGYFYAGCGPLDGLVEVGEAHCIEHKKAPWRFYLLPRDWSDS